MLNFVANSIICSSSFVTPLSTSHFTQPATSWPIKTTSTRRHQTQIEPKSPPIKYVPLSMGIQRPERYSSESWKKSLYSIVKSTVLYRIRSHVFWNTLIAATVAVAHEFTPDSPFWKLSTLPHSLLGTALGLLLVFRTNAAYDRFWEGRKLWGSLVNRSRALSMTAIDYLSQDVPISSERIVRLTIAFAHTLQQHLRGYRSMEEWNEGFNTFTSEEIEEFARIRNRPYYILKLMDREIAKGFSKKLDKASDRKLPSMEPDGLIECAVSSVSSGMQRHTMQQLVVDLVDVMGACERIVKTPVPRSYSRHTSRFITLWCFTLPVVLVQFNGLYVILSMPFIAWALFSIEEIGHMIEDPFLSKKFGLPLENIASNIEADLLDDLKFFFKKGQLKQISEMTKV